MKTKNKILIAAASAASLAIAAVTMYHYVLKPRITVYNAVQDLVPDVGEPFEFFTDFSATNDNTFTYENGHISVEFPVDFKESDREHFDYIRERNEREWIAVVEPTVQKTNFFFIPPKYWDEISKPDGDAVNESFVSFGLDSPETAYDLFKDIYLLENEDYNFWNLDAAKTFLIAGENKCTSLDEITYIYERDDIRGFIDITEAEDTSEDSKYNVSLRIFTTENLDLRTVIHVHTDSLDEAFGIMNSVKPV